MTQKVKPNRDCYRKLLGFPRDAFSIAVVARGRGVSLASSWFFHAGDVVISSGGSRYLQISTSHNNRIGLRENVPTLNELMGM